MNIDSRVFVPAILFGFLCFIFFKYYHLNNALVGRFQYGFWDGIADDEYLAELSAQINNKLDLVRNFRENNNCSVLFDCPINDLQYANQVNTSYFWKYQTIEDKLFQKIDSAADKCETLKREIVFSERPLSQEEADYPIGYGIMVHSNIEQFLYQLSSFYHPQNAYCIAIDGNSETQFVRRLKLLETCFPNIHVFQAAPITYCGYEVLWTLWRTVEKLTMSKHPWKYFQYLSGVDLPLKTNREMVKIFKALNGSFNVDIMPIENYRIPTRADVNFKMWKSSMSSLFSRESAKYMVENKEVQNYIKHLRSGSCQDESLWGTVAGQPDVFDMPGGFNASELVLKIQDEIFAMQKSQILTRKIPSKKEPFPLNGFYISRYQIWDRIDYLNVGNYCKGKFVSLSCVFGPNALVDLDSRSELVVHKLYFDLFPSTFFCLYERIWLRALNMPNQEAFDASYFKNLALVRYQQNKSFQNSSLYF